MRDNLQPEVSLSTPELRYTPTVFDERRPVPPALNAAAIEDAVGYILDDCFFAVGQAVGTRKIVDQTAVIWWRDRYRAKFARTIGKYGNRWLQDRSRVIRSIRLLGERAVFHAGDQPSIDLSAAMKAAADMEKYCTLHSARRASRSGVSLDDPMRYAGYWCTD